MRLLCLAECISLSALREERVSGSAKQEMSLKPHGLQKKKQEAKAARDTSGCRWMCTGQRAAHGAGTAMSRGINISWEHAGEKTRGQG